jgi:hypothetical protein
MPLTIPLQMRVSFLLFDLTPLVLLPSWSAMVLVFWSLLWVLLMVVSVYLMSLLLLRWFTNSFLFVNLQLTIFILWSLTLLAFL